MVPISQVRNLKTSSQKMVLHLALNGQAERAVRVFKEGIEKLEEGDMQDKKSRFLLKYRPTPNTTTGFTPVELLMKRKLRTKLDLIVRNTESLARQKQEHQKQNHDHHAKHRDFETSDPVFIKDFSSPKSWQKETVVQTTGPVNHATCDVYSPKAVESFKFISPGASHYSCPGVFRIFRREK